MSDKLKGCREALELCVKALYDAVERSSLETLPEYAGQAIQQAQYVLESVIPADQPSIKKWKCSFCEDPCFLQIENVDGRPKACVFELGSQYKVRWDEVDS